MALRLSFGTRLFRTRNPARDAETDFGRLEAVRRSIVEAIASADQERAGLQKRVDLHYTRAALLLDEAPEFETRSPAEEAEIAEAERNAGAAFARVKQIEEQLALLERMLATMDGLSAALPNRATDSAAA